MARYVDVTPAEIAHLTDMALAPRVIEPKSVIVQEGADCTHCYLILDGWTGSYTDWRDGNRSLTRIQMCGDLVGITNLPFTTSTESIIALNRVTVAPISFASVGRIFAQRPRLASVLYLIAQEERARLLDQAAGMLRLDARGRLALILLNLRDRYRTTHGGDDSALDLPLTQYDIADLTGLTPTHVNRVLQKFREDGHIELRRHVLTINREDILERFAERPVRAVNTEIRWLPTASGSVD